MNTVALKYLSYLTLSLGLLAAIKLIAPGILPGLPIGEPSGDAAAEKPSSDFAFVFHDTVDGALFLTTIDGRRRTRLTSPTGTATDVSPVWSPDLDSSTDGYQGKIAFFRRPNATFAEGELYTVNPDGSDLQSVVSLQWGIDPVPLDQTTGGSDGENTLAWSPNGREIVFAFRGCLWSVEVSSGAYRCLMESRTSVGDPAISAVNKQIAFHSGGDLVTVNFDFDHAGLMAIDQASMSSLTGNGFVVMDDCPAWSPNGQCLAYRRNARELVVRDLETGKDCVVMADGVQSEPIWSPDGLQLGFCARVENGSESPHWNIFRVKNYQDDDQRDIVPVSSDVTRSRIEADWNPGWGWTPPESKSSFSKQEI